SESELHRLPCRHAEVGCGDLASHRLGTPCGRHDELPQLPRQRPPDSRRAHAGKPRLRPPDGRGALMGLRAPALLTILGFLLTLAFVWSPGPYLMAAFTFVAQPLFVIAALLYLRHVLIDLRDRDVL